MQNGRGTGLLWTSVDASTDKAARLCSAANHEHASRIPSRKPFLPSDLPRDPPGRAFARACFAAGKNTACGYQNSAEQVAQLLWPRDLVTHAVAKAATNPTSMAGTGALSGTATADFLGSLVGESAGARLITAGMRIPLDGVAAVNIPHRSTALPALDAQWIAEAGPFPVKQYVLASSTLGPTKKMIASVALTNEMAQSSGGEEVFAQLLREDLAGSLDASLFSNTAGSAIRPPGLLSGVSPLTATTGGGASALQGDIAKVGGAVAAATGSANIAFIASPAYALRMMTYKTVLEPSEDGVQIWPSIAVPDAQLIAIAISAFVSGFGAVPRISVSEHAVMHLEDTTPLPIGQPGPIVASPSRSLWQTDSVAVRAILDCAWCLRSAGAIGWIQTGITW